MTDRKLRLRALETLVHLGVARGDEFMASFEEVRVLIAQGRAEPVREEVKPSPLP